jgi:hypothetical protein
MHSNIFTSPSRASVHAFRQKENCEIYEIELRTRRRFANLVTGLLDPHPTRAAIRSRRCKTTSRQSRARSLAAQIIISVDFETVRTPNSYRAVRRTKELLRIMGVHETDPGHEYMFDQLM